MPFYFPSSPPVTDDIHQLERWLRAEFTQVQLGSDAVQRLLALLYATYVPGAYGGIGLDAETPISDINATPQILPFDVELIANPRGITYALLNQGMQFNDVGTYRMNAKVSLTFLELNAGRRMTLRLFNVSTGLDIGPEFNFAIGRNTDGVNLNFNLLVQIPETIVGDTLVLRVYSNTDTFTGVTAIGSIWDANNVAEYQGDAFDREVGSASIWQ